MTQQLKIKILRFILTKKAYDNLVERRIEKLCKLYDENNYNISRECVARNVNRFWRSR